MDYVRLPGLGLVLCAAIILVLMDDWFHFLIMEVLGPGV